MRDPVKPCQGEHSSLCECSGPVTFSRLYLMKRTLAVRCSNLRWRLKTIGLRGTFRLLCARCRGAQHAGAAARVGEPHGREVLNLRPGEWVEVKSEDEIIATLDATRRHAGLLWMSGMNRYCGKRLRVLKRVERMRLEATGEYRTPANTVILESATCDGKPFLDCGRNCFFFWREAWLRRVADAAHQVPTSCTLAPAGQEEPCLRPRDAAERRMGLVLWLTGLSGAGKSTLADRVCESLVRRGCDVERLDGDALRAAFPGTGFTREARDEHIKRVGYMASLLEKHGVIVVCSFISPYRQARDFVRGLCRNFVEVHVKASIEECRRRDVKGLYAKAGAGEVKQFTGLDDPYEPPQGPEVVVDTERLTIDEAATVILQYVERYL